MTASKLIKQIHKHKSRLHDEFQVEALYLFGSFARDEATRTSDVDLLVEFSSDDVGLFEFVRLKEFLETVLKRRVDLVTRDALRSWMVADVERDLIRAA